MNEIYRIKSQSNIIKINIFFIMKNDNLITLYGENGLQIKSKDKNHENS